MGSSRELALMHYTLFSSVKILATLNNYSNPKDETETPNCDRSVTKGTQGHVRGGST
jgi:hypothetical protein